ncbi:MAG: ECF transporter S component [Clostridium sp.]
MNYTKTKQLIIMGLSVSINLLGCTIALVLKLPIYLDSIGTILSSVILGPIYGAFVGVGTAIVNGITFDPISIYFMPSQIVTALVVGFLFKNKVLDRKQVVFRVIIVGLATSLAAGTVVYILFGGVTSSGSSIIVAMLKGLNINPILSVYAVQAVTEVIDKSIGCYLVFKVAKSLKLKYIGEESTSEVS